MIRILIVCALLAWLVACGSAPKGGAVQTPPARVVCTKAADEGYVISFFRALGFDLKIAQSIDGRDVAALCAPVKP